jgi:hypothetical protein
MKHLSGFLLRVFLQSDAGDELAGEIVQQIQATLDIVHKDDAIFEGEHAAVAHLGTKDLAAEQRWDSSGVEREAEKAAQEGNGFFAIEPEVGIAANVGIAADLGIMAGGGVLIDLDSVADLLFLVCGTGLEGEDCGW